MTDSTHCEHANKYGKPNLSEIDYDLVEARTIEHIRHSSGINLDPKGYHVIDSLTQAEKYMAKKAKVVKPKTQPRFPKTPSLQSVFGVLRDDVGTPKPLKTRAQMLARIQELEDHIDTNNRRFEKGLDNLRLEHAKELSGHYKKSMDLLFEALGSGMKEGSLPRRS